MPPRTSAQGMSNHNTSRVQPGVSEGGQFATETRSEPEVTLAGDPRELPEKSRGVFEVHDTTTSEDSGFITIRSRPLPHRGAPALATGKLVEATSEQVDLHELDGKKVTALLQLRTGAVQAVEGTVRIVDDSLALLSKGSRTRGRYVGEGAGARVLGVESGYGKARVLADRWDAAARQTLATDEATFDDIPVYTGYSDPPEEIAAVYQFSHPGFDEGQDGRGSLFFATDVQLDEDGQVEVVNGYGVFAGDSGLSSENGSMYAQQLSDWGGRVSEYEPDSLKFGDAMQLGRIAEDDMVGVYEAVRTGQVPAR